MVSTGSIWADAGLKINNGDFSEYAAKLKTAEGQIGEFSSVSQGLIATAFTLPAVAVGGIAAYGSTMAASYEKTQLQLEGLLGSQQKAGEMMQWLQSFAATTPFEFPELADSSAKLMGAGMDAKEFMTIIGDVSAGTQKSIDQVTEAFIDAQTGEWERLKELQIQHIEISKKNYAQLGATADQVGLDMLYSYDANGQKIVEIFDKHSKEATEAALKNLAVEKFSGSMEKVASSLSGKWSTIKDNINNALVDIVGFEVGEENARGLYAALKGLADVAIVVTGAFSGMSEPMQTFVTVAAVGVAAVGLLAAGFIAYGAASTLYASVTGIMITETLTLGAAISASIWPATLIVGTLALVAAGLVYLDEKTGIVTYSWNLFKDLFTITSNGILTAAGILWDGLIYIFEQIKIAISSIIPDGFINKVGNTVGGIIDMFSRMGINIHAQAEGIRGDTTTVGTSTEQAGSKVQSATGKMVSDFTGAGQAALGMSSNVAGAAGGVNSLTTSMQTSSSSAATFISYLNSVSTGLANARANATSAASAMMAAGASMEQAQKAYHAYMQSTKSGNALGISSSGGNGTGEGSVKIRSNPTQYTQSELTARQTNKAKSTTVNVGTINNYSSSSGSKTKLSVLSGG